MFTVKTWEQATELLKNDFTENYIVQFVVYNPYLVDESEPLDIEVFALLTRCKPLTLFLHKNGFATAMGLPLTDVMQKLKKVFVNVDDLNVKIKDVIIKTMLSTQSDLIQQYKNVGIQNKFNNDQNEMH